jgi:hypothetical protein|tara:strand:+ start:497 stop:643 length:147 start_codon:yes stop_codon:yes gene_type:complete
LFPNAPSLLRVVAALQVLLLVCQHQTVMGVAVEAQASLVQVKNQTKLP